MTNVWYDRHRREHDVRLMSHRYLRNVRGFLLQNAPSITFRILASTDVPMDLWPAALNDAEDVIRRLPVMHSIERELQISTWRRHLAAWRRGETMEDDPFVRLQIPQTLQLAAMLWLVRDDHEGERTTHESS